MGGKYQNIIALSHDSLEPQIQASTWIFVQCRSYQRMKQMLLLCLKEAGIIRLALILLTKICHWSPELVQVQSRNFQTARIVCARDCEFEIISIGLQEWFARSSLVRRAINKFGCVTGGNTFPCRCIYPKLNIVYRTKQATSQTYFPKLQMIL